MKSKIHEHKKNNIKMVSKHLFVTITAVLILSSCGNKKTESHTN
jgi:hypothetical protein